MSPARTRRLPLLLVALLAMLAAAAPRAAAQGADVVRGRIVGPDSQPVAGAVVTVTSLSGAVNRTARTDRAGRFTVVFPGGEGDYMVSIAALGYAARRFEVKRTADQEILVADARLQRVSTVLDAVKVTAPRDRVRRGDPPPDVGGTETAIENQSALPAASLGDLAAMAATLPGVQGVPGQNGAADGYSVLGLGADQNGATLNGMSFGGAGLPRDAGVVSSMATAPYDVSRGGFSGAQMSLRTRPGSNFVTRGTSLNVDAPQLQWTDRAARALGQEYGSVSLGGLLAGPLVFDRAFYNLSYQLGRRSSDLRTLLDTDASGLQAAGVSADSVARLLGILGTARVPTTVGRLPGSRLSDQGSLFGSVDVAPPNRSSGTSYNVTFNGGWSSQRPAGALATDVPAFSGERTSWRGGVQGRHSSYVTLRGVGILSETSLGASASRSWSEPYVSMPAGRVRVSSTFGDGTSGVQTLAFGGNPALDSRQTTRGLDYLNQLSWFSADNRHRIKLTSELRGESLDLYQASNLLGSYSFNSLADLDAGRPASFTRTLAPRERTASQITGGASLGDAWRRSDALQIQYGLRVDGNRFLSAPAYNADVARTFGVRNDRVPDRLYVSPRLGFSWTYGSAAQIGGFEGAARVPRAVVRGGVGVFQGLPATQQLGTALDNTGLATGLQQILCVGSAAPTPAWSAWAMNQGIIPDRCADGTAGSAFANAAPNVTLFARDWRAPRSVRSNLQWAGPVLGNRFSAQLDGTYSLNLAQGSLLDRNFDPTVRFTLDDEDHRPVYARPSSIVPTSGALAARDAAVSPAWSRVTELRSDMRSESRQLGVRVSPVRFSTAFNWSLAYTYANVRERARGFTSTVGNPLAVEWGRGGFDSRHQIVYSLDYNVMDAVRVSWFGTFRSGNPFTPSVVGDVNGDGWADDRAYVFDPAHTADATLAADMQSLLRGGSAAARDCLRRQLGRLAGRNSCQGPWTSTATMSLTLNPAKVRMPQRASLSLQLANPLGAADMLLHSSNGLRGWGQYAVPDQALLYVRGFDPAARRYRYDVNQRFGATSPAASAFRAPVALTALMRFDLGPTREQQMLTQQLDRGRRTQGDRMPAPLLRAIYGNGGLQNPLATILRQQDSLHLTAAQADSIAAMNRAFVVRTDSIWSPVTKYLGNLGDSYDRREAYGRYLAARRATVDILADVGPTVKRLLTDEQLRRLPPYVASYLEPRFLASIRSGTVAFTGGMMIPGGGPMTMMSGPAMMGGGGGGERIIIRQ